MTFRELSDRCIYHNKANKITSQFSDKSPLNCFVVFSIESFTEPYSELERTYQFRSDNKYFLDNMNGSSIFAHCLGAQDDIRLDYYLNEWFIEKCYIK